MNPHAHCPGNPGSEIPSQRAWRGIAGATVGTFFGRRSRAIAVAFVALALPATGLCELTMDSLLSDTKMTPRKFAGLFGDFTFDTHPFDVQDPEVFLSTRTGDCIDYAVLAGYVLKRNGYDTRLIRVEMVGKNSGHAVCYVTRDRVYLDYNNREYFMSLVHTSPTIREIATKVAASFEAHWTFAAEFTYDYNSCIKHVVVTVVQTDPASTDPAASRYRG